MTTSSDGATEGPTLRSTLKMFGQLMYQWLCLLSCLSGNVYFDLDRVEYQGRSPWQRKVVNAGPDLQTQLEDLLDCVWRQEKLWRLEKRIQGLGI